MEEAQKIKKKMIIYAISSKERLFIRFTKYISEVYFVTRRRSEQDIKILGRLKRSKMLNSISYKNSIHPQNKPFFYSILKYQGRYLKEVNPKFRRSEYFVLVIKCIIFLRRIENAILLTNSIGSWKIFLYCTCLRKLTIQVENPIRDRDKQHDVGSAWIRSNLNRFKRHVSCLQNLETLRIESSINSVFLALMRSLGTHQHILQRLKSFDLKVAEIKQDQISNYKRVFINNNLLQHLSTLNYSTPFSKNEVNSLMNAIQHDSHLKRLMLTFDGEEISDWTCLSKIGHLQNLEDLHLTVLSTISHFGKSFFQNFTLAKNLKRIELTLDRIDNLDFENIQKELSNFYKDWQILERLEDFYLIATLQKVSQDFMRIILEVLHRIKSLVTLQLVVQERKKKQSSYVFPFADFMNSASHLFSTLEDLHLEVPRLSFENLEKRSSVIRKLANLTLKSDFAYTNCVNQFLGNLKPRDCFTLKFHRQKLDHNEFRNQIETIKTIPKLSILKMSFLIYKQNSDEMIRDICELLRDTMETKVVFLQFENLLLTSNQLDQIEEEFINNPTKIIVRIITKNMDRTFEKPDSHLYYFMDEM